MKKKLRVIVVWIVVSLLLQFGAYAYLDKQVAKVIGPINDTNAPITKQLEATIPGSGFENIQVSYDKEYLAYIENKTLKVFNLKKEKIVFQKEVPANSDNSMGVLSYQWLPDRDTLLYFYAKKNPNPVTYVQVPITPPKTNPTETKPENKADPKTEDPNEKPDTTSKVETKAPPVQTRTEARYNNPQITELYTLELPVSDEDIAPDDRFNQTIDAFPAGGKIAEMVFSTSTNLIYLTIKNSSGEKLMEIDVMKNVRTLNRSGETINGMAASDRYGTLFINSKIGNTKQILSLGVGDRHVISKSADDRILGVRDGKIYVGEVKDNALVKIKTTEDLSEIKDNPSFKTEWEGSIPFAGNATTLIGSKGQVIINNQETAYIITAGKMETISLQGDQNFISDDGAELIQLEKTGVSTLVKLKPLKEDKQQKS